MRGSTTFLWAYPWFRERQPCLLASCAPSCNIVQLLLPLPEDSNAAPLLQAALENHARVGGLVVVPGGFGLKDSRSSALGFACLFAFLVISAVSNYESRRVNLLK